MNQYKSLPHVGAQVLEMKNSPIVDDSDEDIYVIRQEMEEQPYCFFNNVSYSNGVYVHSGTDVLVCNNGLWIYQGNSDPDKP